MNLREAAIQAMKELNWPETTINTVLLIMDRQDPVAAEKAKERLIDPSVERKLINTLKVSYKLGLGAKVQLENN